MESTTIRAGIDTDTRKMVNNVELMSEPPDEAIQDAVDDAGLVEVEEVDVDV